MRLTQNQTMIITGASRGIGRALALDLAARGVNVVLNARSAEPLELTAELCREMDVQALAIPGNSAGENICHGLVSTAMDMGNFRGFVHAAAALMPGPLVSELSPRDFDAVFEQVTAAHRLTHAAYPLLIKQGGGLAVFFGSGAADIVQPGIGAYCAAKAAMHQLMRNIAAEQKEIVCLAFRPGIVETRMQQEARASEGGGSATLRKVFQAWKDKGELLTPEESAKALGDLLTSDPGRFHGKVVGMGDIK
jgi:NAD(P)-dependent dehydrogenase (short-subunit alcohol dehydrogenase family)